jgi:phenylacetate-CoA ligase
MNTSLTRRAAPLLRYATGDIVQVFTSPCPGCGFEGPRVKVIGRSDDMLIVKGTNVYPAAIKQEIASFAPETTGEMRVVLSGPPPRVVPPLVVKVEFGPTVRADDLPGLTARIKGHLSSKLKVSPEIEWVAPRSLERAMTKTPLFEKNY